MSFKERFPAQVPVETARFVEPLLSEGRVYFDAWAGLLGSVADINQDRLREDPPEAAPLKPGASDALVFALALASGMLLAAVAGLVVGIPSLRLRGDYLAIVTLKILFREVYRQVRIVEVQFDE